uniref:hypothetical protein n=1 Tax=Desulfosarcina cetonica TaxID=90730 RepID=UPI00155DA1E2
ALSNFSGPVIDFRRLTGEFATATAVAAVAGIHWLATGNPTLAPAGKGVLLLGLGRFITATPICPP